MSRFVSMGARLGKVPDFKAGAITLFRHLGLEGMLMVITVGDHYHHGSPDGSEIFVLRLIYPLAKFHIGLEPGGHKYYRLVGIDSFFLKRGLQSTGKNGFHGIGSF